MTFKIERELLKATPSSVKYELEEYAALINFFLTFFVGCAIAPFSWLLAAVVWSVGLGLGYVFHQRERERWQRRAERLGLATRPLPAEEDESLKLHGQIDGFDIRIRESGGFIAFSLSGAENVEWDLSPSHGDRLVADVEASLREANARVASRRAEMARLREAEELLAAQAAEELRRKVEEHLRRAGEVERRVRRVLVGLPLRDLKFLPLRLRQLDLARLHDTVAAMSGSALQSLLDELEVYEHRLAIQREQDWAIEMPSR